MKEFKTVEEQIALLRSRGMEVDSDAAPVLLREGYYSVVNGYKGPFLDREAMQASSEDVYLPGTRFDWLYSLFRFDRELRGITFHYLMQAEAALETATVHAFCESHGDCSDYLERTAFCSERDMLVPKSFKGNKAALYRRNLNSLMGVLSKKTIATPMTRPFVRHYISAYGEVPLWVLANDLTFGNMSHFFQLMQRRDQNAACKNLYATTLRTRQDERITPHEVLRAYQVLSRFRNLCAHDERLYCAKIENDAYPMMRLMEIALPAETVNQLRANVTELTDRYETALPIDVVDEVRECLELHSQSKDKSYPAP